MPYRTMTDDTGLNLLTYGARRCCALYLDMYYVGSNRGGIIIHDNSKKPFRSGLTCATYGFTVCIVVAHGDTAVYVLNRTSVVHKPGVTFAR